MTSINWHGKPLSRKRLTTVVILSSLLALTVFGLVAVHGSFDMDSECVRWLHLNRQNARKTPMSYINERISTSRQKCSNAIYKLEQYWEQFRRDANYGAFATDLIYKICSPRQWNFEKWAFRSMFILFGFNFSLGVWAHFLLPLAICLLGGVMSFFCNRGLSRDFFKAALTIADSCTRAYFLWVPEIFLLWALRALFATSLTGHLVFSGYNGTWALVFLIITLPAMEIQSSVKRIVTVATVLSIIVVSTLQCFTLYTTFRYIHADSDVTITAILFFWLMLFQGELYPVFFELLASPKRIFLNCLNCFNDRFGNVVREDHDKDA